VTYFFFNVGNEHKQTVFDFLRTIYPELEDEPDSSMWTKDSDRVGELLKRLTEELSRENAVTYLVIDALDECSVDERELLLPLLTNLVRSHQPSWRIFVTSRMNMDIMNAMNLLNAVRIRISGQEVEGDILAFIKFEIDNNPRLRRLPMDVRDQIVFLLSRRSEGS
jgi:hypothetical protein